MTTPQREKSLEILSQMLGPEMASAIKDSDASNLFAGHIGELAMANVFDPLWTRKGLDRRTRSLVTLGILIALRATEEMAVHFPAAVRNGATVAELEEVVYQATAYAGFPAAKTARDVAEAALKKAGMFP